MTKKKTFLLGETKLLVMNKLMKIPQSRFQTYHNHIEDQLWQSKMFLHLEECLFFNNNKLVQEMSASFVHRILPSSSDFHKSCSITQILWEPRSQRNMICSSGMKLQCLNTKVTGTLNKWSVEKCDLIYKTFKTEHKISKLIHNNWYKQQCANSINYSKIHWKGIKPIEFSITVILTFQ